MLNRIAILSKCQFYNIGTFSFIIFSDESVIPKVNEWVMVHNKELCKITTTPQFSYVGSSVSTVTTEEQNCLNFLKPFVYMPGTLNEEDTYINPILYYHWFIVLS
jgi:hypothetical protein